LGVRLLDIAAIRAVVEFLKSLIPEGGPSAIREWLFKGSPFVLRLFAIFFLLLGVLFGFVVWQDISATNEVVMRALRSPLEATPHPDTAIEAVLLASVLKTSTTVGGENSDLSAISQETPTISDEFKKDLDKIQIQLDSLVTSASSTTPQQTPPPPPPKEITLDVLPGTGEGLTEKIVTDEKPGFLFIPGRLVPDGPVPDQRSQISLKQEASPSLFSDIVLSQKLSKTLCGDLSSKYSSEVSQNVPVFAKNPSNVIGQFKQAYIIFASGVGRLCETKQVPPEWTQQRDYYSDKLPSSTFLPERPYFGETVRNKAGSAEYWNSPYIDLGGNGVIQTFCRYLHAGAQDVVLCFDFPLSEGLETAVRTQVARFGGSVTKFLCNNKVCSLQQGEPALSTWLASILHPANRLTEEEIHQINEKFRLASRNQFFGKVSVLNNRLKTDVDVLLVPTGENNEILAIKLDLASYQWWRSFWLLLAVGSWAGFLLAATLIFVDYALKFREQERAFNAVDTVMSDVPAPYARVDNDGKFVKVNDAFGKLVGFSTAAEALPELRNYRYEEFLADDDSTREYAAIKQERLDGMPYRSYLVRLWTGRRPGIGPVVYVKVHGGDVPTPHAARDKPGQSFGILLRTEAPRPIAVMGAHDQADIEITEASA
jgi:PAS domain-containing protein